MITVASNFSHIIIVGRRNAAVVMYTFLEGRETPQKRLHAGGGLLSVAGLQSFKLSLVSLPASDKWIGTT